MFGNDIRLNVKDKAEIRKIINSDEFKELFLKNNITNVIIFGSFTSDDFSEISDIDIAIIGEDKLDFNSELILTQELEEILNRDVDLIDINDENINNMIKISALNGKIIILNDNLLEEAKEFYDNLARENEEFWRILDREVLGIE